MVCDDAEKSAHGFSPKIMWLNNVRGNRIERRPAGKQQDQPDTTARSSAQKTTGFRDFQNRNRPAYNLQAKCDEVNMKTGKGAGYFSHRMFFSEKSFREGRTGLIFRFRDAILFEQNYAGAFPYRKFHRSWRRNRQKGDRLGTANPGSMTAKTGNRTEGGVPCLCFVVYGTSLSIVRERS
ncbi:hypothetical protein [uncultured Victivallis sp.]|uniref:hypothetical protein n=1 Tax=uncultured Victivallis sp. TaxID=354118 RepID=UPI00260041E9|nr:hypothetical protein [uncultured Victivallis sp.]